MPSDMKGILRPSICRFRLGGFEITNILDGVSQRDGPHPMFGADQPAEVVQRHAAANRLPPDRFEHSFTPTIVNTGRELVLFDTGNGPPRRGAGLGRLRALLDDAGYAPEDVDVVVITHCHPDHIGGLLEDVGDLEAAQTEAVDRGPKNALHLARHGDVSHVVVRRTGACCQF